MILRPAIVLFADIRFPSPRANGIQVVKTAHALATRGREVRLVVRHSDPRPTEEILAEFGVETTARLHDHVRVNPDSSGFSLVVTPPILGSGLLDNNPTPEDCFPPSIANPESATSWLPVDHEARTSSAVRVSQELSTVIAKGSVTIAGVISLTRTIVHNP